MSDLNGVCFIRRGNVLVPADFNAEEFLDGIKEGREVIVTIRKARSPLHHRLFFGILKMVVDNSDDWQNVDVLLDELKMGVGEYEVRFNLFTGKPYARPKSINFAAMDQNRFKVFFDRCMDLLTGKIGYDPVEILKQYERRLPAGVRRWRDAA